MVVETIWIILILVAVAAAAGGTSLALVRARRRDQIVGLEPAPDAPRVPDAVKEEVAEHKRQLLAELEEREGGPPPDIEAELNRVVGERTPGTEPPAATTDVTDTGVPVTDAAEPVVEDAEPVVEDAPRPRFRDRLSKARSKLSGMVGALAGRSQIDEDAWDEIEEALIGADVGIEPTQELLDHLRAQVKAQGLETGDQLLAALKAEFKARLTGHDLSLAYAEDKPSVWLFVGVNGVGKTTTIGKLGTREVRDGKKVVMAAGDTFRAAAAEQLGHVGRALRCRAGARQRGR